MTYRQRFSGPKRGSYSALGKEQGWNNFAYFFNRFNSGHPFVTSSLYARTAARLFCSATVDPEANAMEHYDKSLAGVGDQLGVDMLSANATDEVSQTWLALLAQADNMEAVSVTLYLLAWTAPNISRCVALSFAFRAQGP